MAALHTSALTSLPLLARGKVRDNYAVYAKAKSALSALPGAQVIEALRAAYPKCVFTWCAKPAPVKAPA